MAYTARFAASVAGVWDWAALDRLHEEYKGLVENLDEYAQRAEAWKLDAERAEREMEIGHATRGFCRLEALQWELRAKAVDAARPQSGWRGKPPPCPPPAPIFRKLQWRDEYRDVTGWVEAGRLSQETNFIPMLSHPSIWARERNVLQTKTTRLRWVLDEIGSRMTHWEGLREMSDQRLENQRVLHELWETYLAYWRAEAEEGVKRREESCSKDTELGAGQSRDRQEKESRNAEVNQQARGGSMNASQQTEPDKDHNCQTSPKQPGDSPSTTSKRATRPPDKDARIRIPFSFTAAGRFLFDLKLPGSNNKRSETEELRDREARARIEEIQRERVHKAGEERKAREERVAEAIRTAQAERRAEAERAKAQRTAEAKKRAEEEKIAYECFMRHRRERMRERIHLAANGMRAAWNSYQARWEALPALQPLPWTFASVPWPLLSPPRCPADITATAVRAFIWSNAHSEGVDRKQRVRKALLRWHPDKFEGRWIQNFVEQDRDSVREGVNSVVHILNNMLAAV